MRNLPRVVGLPRFRLTVRRLQVTCGLIVTSLVAGCYRGSAQQEVTSVSSLEHPTVPTPRRDNRRVTTSSPTEAAHRATAPRKDSEAIILKVEYHRGRGPCVRFADGSLAMPVMDYFKVVGVVRGRLKATIINVRAFTPKSSGYPQNMTEDQTLTVRLTLSDESWKQAEANEQQSIRFLFINGDEVEQVIMR